MKIGYPERYFFMAFSSIGVFYTIKLIYKIISNNNGMDSFIGFGIIALFVLILLLLLLLALSLYEKIYNKKRALIIVYSIIPIIGFVVLLVIIDQILK